MDLKVGQSIISKETSPYRTEGQAYPILEVGKDYILVRNNFGKHGRFKFTEFDKYFKHPSHELWI